MRKSIWAFSLIFSVSIGYFSFLSDYTSQKLFLGIPLYFYMILIQTISVLALLTYAGLKKEIELESKEDDND